MRGVVTVMDTARGRGSGLRLALRVAGAGLLIATAAIHLDLYLTGYNSIPTIGPLFLLQIIAGFGLGLLILATGDRLIAGLGALFALSTLGGYLISVQFGLFGFREVRTTAGVWAGILEILAFALLAWLTALPGRSLLLRTRDGGERELPGQAMLTRFGLPAVALVALVAAGLLGGALAGAGGTTTPIAGGTGGGGALGSATIGGVKVLTDAQGRTLYWFAPDTSGKSTCYGTCAQYWPPVAGPAHAGNGVTGTLGTTQRTGGGVQETYNGHPLYTYIGDTGPGQAHGNNVNLNGGLWHEVVVSS
jgi:predicted lipoprotein with Yx(FWY)xxD motif